MGVRLLGRQKIYTNEKVIDRTNIIDVLADAYTKHRRNVREMQYLINYERGEQPMKRDKIIRSDIDIRVASSLPNYIKRFKVGYNWGSTIMLVQRGGKELHDTDPKTDDKGIGALNELWKNIENIGYKDMCMAEFVEICGIGHKMVDIKTDFPENLNGPYNGSMTENYFLDSRYAFCVYNNGPGQKKVLGASFAKSNGKLRFTCFTDKSRFEIDDWKIEWEEKNLLGMINIIEYERSFDRTGCFERKISAIDALNIKESDFANDIAQRTQEIWWGDNIDFKTDEKGNQVKPESGDWILTTSGEGKTAKIQPLSSTFDSAATLSAIENDRITILQDCYVPIQYSSSGGGSTGIATDMSSGWSAAELDALQEQQMTSKGKREELELTIRALQFVPERILPIDAPIRKIHSSDVDFRFLRSKNYDMTVKANAFSTYFQNGVHPRHALKLTDAFDDVEQVYLDSKEMFDALQKNMVGQSRGTEEQTNAESSAGDPANQVDQSPIVDGINMNTNA